MSKQKTVKLPKAGTAMRKAADALLKTKSKAWWTPEDRRFARCAQVLRDDYHWPIEDERPTGERYNRYRLDPERRVHYVFK